MASISALGGTLSLPTPRPGPRPTPTPTPTPRHKWRGPQSVGEADIVRFRHPKTPRGCEEGEREGVSLSNGIGIGRRNIVISSVALAAAAAAAAAPLWNHGLSSATAAQFADMPALRGKDYGKTKMKYPDYTQTESGLQYKVTPIGHCHSFSTQLYDLSSYL
ncbi:Peptidyl-prolyl cis-trans isomerase, FKBP-type [Trema orientale]|uniref:Peptidyl-prolyl cis-trans isomerase, FKBP-type n=1 Tax=Trema orientale TaxID=63057 RepID=A0A2P5F1U9_TREOI|nr:Peptidyl-prolyl cis-trans isomerase, FKBP-type [Trema orientale]